MVLSIAIIVYTTTGIIPPPLIELTSWLFLLSLGKKLGCWWAVLW
jgi:hypothetical protein